MSKDNNNAGIQISTKAFLSSVFILFCLMMIAGILTHIIPGGAFEKTIEKYELYTIQLHRVPHFFQAPGYYISYGVSALAALELWDAVYKDFDLAVDMYTDFSHISHTDGTGFVEALYAAGFDDVFETGIMQKKIERLAMVLSENIVYGDIDENGIVSASDLVWLIKTILGTQDISEHMRAVCDLSADDLVNTSDIIKMKLLLMK